MHNCVCSYAARCARGEARIFTLTKSHGDAARGVATIEVHDRKIVQVRGPGNRVPSSAAEGTRAPLGAGH
jgi:hypothetical protein